MSTVTMNVHDVTQVHVGPVRNLKIPGNSGRAFQIFTFTGADGSRTEINVFFDKDKVAPVAPSFFDPE